MVDIESVVETNHLGRSKTKKVISKYKTSIYTLDIENVVEQYKNEGVMTNTYKFEAELMTEEMLRIVRPDRFESSSIDLSRFQTLTIKPTEIQDFKSETMLTKKQQRNLDKKNKKKSNQ